MSDPILVTGATGTQGGHVTRALLARGRRVRALTRDPGKPAARALAEAGAEVVAGDFTDPDSLRRAAEATAAVFAMGTPFEAGPQAEEQQGIELLDAVADAGTGHVIYTSVASALDGTGIPHFESKAAVERHLGKLDVGWTVVAPVAFLENVYAPWVAPGLKQGVYSFPLAADIPIQMVAVDDIAGFAAVVVEQPERFAGQRIELASVEVTGAGFAGALSRWIGRPVRHVETEVDPADTDLRAMSDFFRRGGYQVDIPALRKAYPEVGWHDLDAWAAGQDWSPFAAG